MDLWSDHDPHKRGSRSDHNLGISGSDLEFFSPKKQAKSYQYHDSLPFLKIEPIPIFFPDHDLIKIISYHPMLCA